MPRTKKKKAAVIDVDDNSPVEADDCLDESELLQGISSDESIPSRPKASRRPTSCRKTSEETKHSKRPIPHNQQEDDILLPFVQKVGKPPLNGKSKASISDEILNDFLSDLGSSLTNALDSLKSGCHVIVTEKSILCLWKWCVSLSTANFDPESHLFLTCCAVDLYALQKHQGGTPLSWSKQEAGNIADAITSSLRTVCCSALTQPRKDDGPSPSIPPDQNQAITAGMQRLQWRKRFHMLQGWKEDRLFTVLFDTLTPETFFGDWVEASLKIIERIISYNEDGLAEDFKRTWFVDLDRFARIICDLLAEAMQDAAQRTGLPENLYGRVVEMLLDAIFRDRGLNKRLENRNAIVDSEPLSMCQFGYISDICARIFSHLLYGGIINEKLCTAFVEVNRHETTLSCRRGRKVDGEWRQDAFSICRTAELFSIITPKLIERALGLILSDLGGTECNEVVVSLAIRILFSENKEGFKSFQPRLRLELISLFQSKNVNHRLCIIKAAGDIVATQDTSDNKELVESFIEHVVAAAWNETDSKVRCTALREVLKFERVRDAIFIDDQTKHFMTRIGRKANTCDTLVVLCLGLIYRKHAKTIWQESMMEPLINLARDSETKQVPYMALMENDETVLKIPGVILEYLGVCYDSCDGPGIIACEAALSNCLFEKSQVTSIDDSESTERLFDDQNEETSSKLMLGLFGVVYGLHGFDSKYKKGSSNLSPLVISERFDILIRYFQLRFLTNACFTSLAREVEDNDFVSSDSEDESCVPPKKSKKVKQALLATKKQRSFFSKSPALLYSGGNSCSTTNMIIRGHIGNALIILNPSICNQTNQIFSVVDSQIPSSVDITCKDPRKKTAISNDLIEVISNTIQIPIFSDKAKQVQRRCVKVIQQLKANDWSEDWFLNTLSSLKKKNSGTVPVLQRIIPIILSEGPGFYQFVISLHHAISSRIDNRVDKSPTTEGGINAGKLQLTCEGIVNHLIGPLTYLGLRLSVKQTTQPGPTFGLSLDCCMAVIDCLSDWVKDHLSSSNICQDHLLWQKLAAIQKCVPPLLSLSKDINDKLLEKICSVMQLSASKAVDSKAISFAVNALLDLQPIRPTALKNWLLAGIDQLSHAEDRVDTAVSQFLHLLNSVLKVRGRSFFTLLAPEDDACLENSVLDILEGCKNLLLSECRNVAAERMVVSDCLSLIALIATSCEPTRHTSEVATKTHIPNRRLSNLPVSEAQLDIYNDEKLTEENKDKEIFTACQNLLLQGLQNAEYFFVTNRDIDLTPQYIIARPTNPATLNENSEKHQKIIRQMQRARYAASRWLDLIHSSQTVSLYDASSSLRILELVSSIPKSNEKNDAVVSPNSQISVLCARSIISCWRAGIFHHSFSALVAMGNLAYQTTIGPTEKTEIFNALLSLVLPNPHQGGGGGEETRNSNLTALIERNVYFAFLLPSVIASWVGFPPVQFKALKAMQYLVFEILRHAQLKDTEKLQAVGEENDNDMDTVTQSHAFFGTKYKCAATYFSLLFESTLRVLEKVEVLFTNNGEHVFYILMPFVDSLLRIFSCKQHIVVPYLIKQCESITASKSSACNARQETLRSIGKFLLRTHANNARHRAQKEQTRMSNDAQSKKSDKISDEVRTSSSDKTSPEKLLTAQIPGGVLGPPPRLSHETSVSSKDFQDDTCSIASQKRKTISSVDEEAILECIDEVGKDENCVVGEKLLSCDSEDNTTVAKNSEESRLSLNEDIVLLSSGQ